MGAPDDEMVERIAAAVAAKLGRPAPAPLTITWARLWAAYSEIELEHLEAPKTQRAMGRHLVRLWGERVVAGTNIEAVATYRRTRRAEITMRGKPPSQKTVNNEVILIRSLTRWASRRTPALILVDPLAGAKEADLLVPVQNVRLNVVDDNPRSSLSLDSFLSRADDLERAFILVAHSSGVRRKEIASLEMSWIDVERRLILVPPGVAKGRRGKKRGRITVVSESALRALRRYRESLSDEARFSRWVFVNERTLRPYSPDFFTRRFAKVERRSATEGPSGSTWLHDLRRSFITLARRRGEDAVNVMRLAGHSTLESQQRYHVESLDETIRSRDRIEAARAADLPIAPRRRGPRRASPACKIPTAKNKGVW